MEMLQREHLMMRSEQDLLKLKQQVDQYVKLYEAAEDNIMKEFYFQKIEEISQIIVHEYMFD